VVWDGVIVDGHNRYEICERIKKPFSVHSAKFESREAAKEWIVTNQLGRRNLSQIQASYLRGCYYRLMNKGNGGWRGNGSVKVSRGGGPDTAHVLAKQFAVSPSTIRADVWIANAIDKLPADSRAFVFDPDEVTRKQNVIDLSNVSRSVQPRVVAEAKKHGDGLRKVMVKLRGVAVPGSHGVRCKRCGARLAPGIKTCLGCDLKERDIIDKLAQPVDDEPEDGTWKDRLDALSKAKQSGDEISYYANSIIDWVSNNKVERNTTAHKTLGKLLKILKLQLGVGKFPKPWADSPPKQSAKNRFDTRGDGV
jgi:hypothetical protein